MSSTGRGSEWPAVVSYFLGTGTLSSRACTSEESRWQRPHSVTHCPVESWHSFQITGFRA